MLTSKFINYETEGESRQPSHAIFSGSPQSRVNFQVDLQSNTNNEYLLHQKQRTSPPQHGRVLDRNISSLSATTSAFRKSLNSAYNTYGRI